MTTSVKRPMRRVREFLCPVILASDLFDTPQKWICYAISLRPAAGISGRNPETHADKVNRRTIPTGDPW